MRFCFTVGYGEECNKEEKAGKGNAALVKLPWCFCIDKSFSSWYCIEYEFDEKIFNKRSEIIGNKKRAKGEEKTGDN